MGRGGQAIWCSCVVIIIIIIIIINSSSNRHASCCTCVDVYTGMLKSEMKERRSPVGVIINVLSSSPSAAAAHVMQAAVTCADVYTGTLNSGVERRSLVVIVIIVVGVDDHRSPAPLRPLLAVAVAYTARNAARSELGDTVFVRCRTQNRHDHHHNRHHQHLLCCGRV